MERLRIPSKELLRSPTEPWFWNYPRIFGINQPQRSRPVPSDVKQQSENALFPIPTNQNYA